MTDSTIIAATFEPNHGLHSLLLSESGTDSQWPEEDEVSLPLFKIRAAQTPGRRTAASVLIRRRYAWRGYEASPLSNEDVPDRFTLLASNENSVIGTISIGFDGTQGLLVEDLFPEDVRRLRNEGRRICEFTKLAIDSARRSKRVLASLFHVAYIYAYRVKGCDCLLIEVNPRHVKYYERILGFRAIGEPLQNLRVNAPAVLMQLDFTHTEQQIGKFGGRPHMASTERSLYPFSFSVSEEAEIAGRWKT